MAGIRGAAAPLGRVRERRYRRDRTGCRVSSLRSPRLSAAPSPNARGRQTPSHRELPFRERFPDPRGAQAATGRSSSDPITQSFGCSSTRVTNAFSVRARFENSAVVYTVGLTFRPTARVTRSTAPKTSPYVRLSLIRSVSRRVDGHAVWTAGTENEKVAPGPSFGSAQRRPSCLSTIERLTNNPMPMPPLFVV